MINDPESALSHLCEQVSRCRGTRLLEGLPHPSFEKAAFAVERDRPDVVSIDGHLFYASALTPTDEVSTSLREILGSGRSYRTFSGEKFCGGFHPDFAVDWQGGEQRLISLICFGCQEALTVTVHRRLRSDLSKRAYVALYQCLHRFRANRPGPAPEPFEPELVELIVRGEDDA